MKERINHLLDPYKWESIFIRLYDMLEVKDNRASEFIKTAIIEPLEKIVADEFAKHEYSGICTEGIVLLTYARQAINDIARGDLDDMRVPAWDIDHWWRGFYREVAMVAQAKKQKFDDGPKHPRADSLSSEMMATWGAFVDHHGRPPTAIELWDDLPLGAHIQEKEIDGNERTIFWRRPNGREESTGFKSFQNRLTNIRKKMIDSVKK